MDLIVPGAMTATYLKAAMCVQVPMPVRAVRLSMPRPWHEAAILPNAAGSEARNITPSSQFLNCVYSSAQRVVLIRSIFDSLFTRVRLTLY
jgi:hypothetical protein